MDSISEINIIFDNKYKQLVSKFKKDHMELLDLLQVDWHFGVDNVQHIQSKIRNFLPEIFDNCNLSNPNKKCGMPEIYATFLALISPIDNLHCWNDFNYRNGIMKIKEISEKIVEDLDGCICCCGKPNCEPTNMGQVWHKDVNRYIMVGSSCILKKELLDCDIIQKSHAKLERKKKKDKKLEIEKERIKNIKERDWKISFIKGHTFYNITVEQAWLFHDFIQLYYDNKCGTDYDNKLNEMIKDITQGKYSKERNC